MLSVAAMDFGSFAADVVFIRSVACSGTTYAADMK
jgi:hypothetical protein